VHCTLTTWDLYESLGLSGCIADAVQVFDVLASCRLLILLTIVVIHLASLEHALLLNGRGWMAVNATVDAAGTTHNVVLVKTLGPAMARPNLPS